MFLNITVDPRGLFISCCCRCCCSLSVSACSGPTHFGNSLNYSWLYFGVDLFFSPCESCFSSGCHIWAKVQIWFNRLYFSYGYVEMKWVWGTEFKNEHNLFSLLAGFFLFSFCSRHKICQWKGNLIYLFYALNFPSSDWIFFSIYLLLWRSPLNKIIDSLSDDCYGCSW